MPRVIYQGPGDTVEFDGLKVKKGEAIELTVEQIERVRRSDPNAVVENAPKGGK